MFQLHFNILLYKSDKLWPIPNFALISLTDRALLSDYQFATKTNEVLVYYSSLVKNENKNLKSPELKFLPSFFKGANRKINKNEDYKTKMKSNLDWRKFIKEVYSLRGFWISSRFSKMLCH